LFKQSYLTKTLYPLYTETNTTPTAPLYPELHQIQHIMSLPANLFDPQNIQATLKEWNIPDFDLKEPLKRNQIALQNELEQQNQFLAQHQKQGSPNFQKLEEILQQIKILKNLKDRLPLFYKDNDSLHSPYRQEPSSKLSSTAHSKQTSRATSPSISGHIESLSSPDRSPSRVRQLQTSTDEQPFSQYHHTPLNTYLIRKIARITHKYKRNT